MTNMSTFKNLEKFKSSEITDVIYVYKTENKDLVMDVVNQIPVEPIVLSIKDDA